MDGSRKKGWPAEISIKRAANKGYIVRHTFDNQMAGESYRPPEDHAFSEHAAMMAHIRQMTGGGAAPTGVGRASKAKAPGPDTYGAGGD